MFVSIGRGYVVVSATGLALASIRVVSNKESRFALDVAVGAELGEFTALLDERVGEGEVLVFRACISTNGVADKDMAVS